MRTGFLIIISLVLGYLQGVKMKRKKLNIRIQELENENAELFRQLENIKKRKRLSQYSSKAFVKGDSDKFEEELTEVFTLTDEQKDLAIKSFVFLENFSFRNDEEINIKTISEAINKILTKEEFENEVIQSYLGNITYTYLWWETAFATKTFFVDEKYIDLSRYYLSYKELHDSMAYVLSEF